MSLREFPRVRQATTPKLDVVRALHDADILCTEAMNAAVDGKPPERVVADLMARLKGRLYQTVQPGGGTFGGLRTLRELELRIATPPAPRPYLFRTTPRDTPQGFVESDGVIPAGKVGLLAGAGGAGKSYLGVHMALSVATGIPLWSAWEPCCDPGMVLLAAGEEELPEVQRRLHYAAKAMGLDDEAIARAEAHIVPLALAGKRTSLVYGAEELRTSRGTDYETPAFYELLTLLNDFDAPWRLLIIDPLSRFAGPDSEADNAAATRFVQCLEQLSQVSGRPTVIAVHHTNKSSRTNGDADGSAARGVTGLHDGARFMLHAQPLHEADCPPMLLLANPKNNYAPQASTITLVRAQGGALRAASQQEYRNLQAARGGRSNKTAQSSCSRANGGNGGNGAGGSSTDAPQLGTILEVSA